MNIATHQITPQVWLSAHVLTVAVADCSHTAHSQLEGGLSCKEQSGRAGQERLGSDALHKALHA